MKKLYNQPEVQIATIQLGAVVLAGSAAAAGGSGAGKLNTGVGTDDPW
ncbi:MAG: hypothetical protein II825_04020 [Paludibacteraceae bacterium]|nr:hypothetical protein [Paludibacteraceae bacterium]